MCVCVCVCLFQKEKKRLKASLLLFNSHKKISNREKKQYQWEETITKH